MRIAGWLLVALGVVAGSAASHYTAMGMLLAFQGAQTGSSASQVAQGVSLSLVLPLVSSGLLVVAGITLLILDLVRRCRKTAELEDRG
jgi:hypothetical protein